MKVGLIGYLFVSIFIVFIIHSAQAQPVNPVARIVAIRGEAFAQTKGEQKRRLNLKSPIFEEDTIITTQGRLQLIFTDNTLITLGRNTQMRITAYQWKAGSPESALKTSVKVGSFRVMGGAVTKDAPQNFVTETPVATIGIRGSMYAGRINDNQFSVLYQGGKGIFVANEKGRVEIDRPGYGTYVKGSGQAPEKPEKFDQKAIENIESGMAVGQLKEKSPADNETQDQESEQVVDISQETKTTAPQAEDTFTDTQQTPEAVSETITDAGAETQKEESISAVAEEETDSDIDPVSEKEQKILDVLAALGYDTTRAATIPETGIWVYRGIIIDTGTSEFDLTKNPDIIVSWDNRRFIVFNTEEPEIAFGEISDKGEIFNVQVLGSSFVEDATTIYVSDGSEVFGQIYGPNQSAIAVFMEGYDIDVQNQSNKNPWSELFLSKVDEQYANQDTGGFSSLSGFFTGVGEDMSDPYTGRVSFINSESSQFQVTIDKDAGTFSGSLSGDDFLESGTQISNMTVGGGSTESVYITDGLFAASLDGSNVIVNGSGTADLKTYGNYLIPYGDDQLSENTYWGYWEAAYVEPGSNKDYHIHIPSSLWVAGEQTPAAAVNTLISNSFAGNYVGRAEGTKFTDATRLEALTNGEVSLAIDFAANARIPVSGYLNFDQVYLPVQSTNGDLSSEGFHANVSQAVSSSINGTYYGDNAQGIGGNFTAKMPDGYTYQGIFAGDR